jgi:hypothetical protein
LQRQQPDQVIICLKNRIETPSGDITDIGRWRINFTWIDGDNISDSIDHQ